MMKKVLAVAVTMYMYMTLGLTIAAMGLTRWKSGENRRQAGKMKSRPNIKFSPITLISKDLQKIPGQNEYKQTEWIFTHYQC